MANKTLKLLQETDYDHAQEKNFRICNWSKFGPRQSLPHLLCTIGSMMPLAHTQRGLACRCCAASLPTRAPPCAACPPSRAWARSRPAAAAALAAAAPPSSSTLLFYLCRTPPPLLLACHHCFLRHRFCWPPPEPRDGERGKRLKDKEEGRKGDGDEEGIDLKYFVDYRVFYGGFLEVSISQICIWVMEEKWGRGERELVWKEKNEIVLLIFPMYNHLYKDIKKKL